ncbi:chaplin [Sorangium sp. So ce260]|uniref:chaplin n=1 Tax=Sorangium sp. So ce260 TaxID=3133291 RepID=UPI003F5EBF55
MHSLHVPSTMALAFGATMLLVSRSSAIDATGASNSPGFISGNVVQVPLNVPINVCGNSVNIVGLLNPTFGNTCENESENLRQTAEAACGLDLSTEVSCELTVENSIDCAALHLGESDYDLCAALCDTSAGVSCPGECGAACLDNCMGDSTSFLQELSCSAACDVSCLAECSVEASVPCEVECQEELLPDLRASCAAEIDTNATLFCDDTEIEGVDDMVACVDALLAIRE